jgi:hypothetical protein
MLIGPSVGHLHIYRLQIVYNIQMVDFLPIILSRTKNPSNSNKPCKYSSILRKVLCDWLGISEINNIGNLTLRINNTWGAATPRRKVWGRVDGKSRIYPQIESQYCNIFRFLLRVLFRDD